MLLSVLAPVMVSNIAAPVSPNIGCSDASLARGAVCRTTVSPAVAEHLWQSSGQKGWYTRLQGIGPNGPAQGEEEGLLDGRPEAELSDEESPSPTRTPPCSYDFLRFVLEGPGLPMAFPPVSPARDRCSGLPFLQHCGLTLHGVDFMVASRAPAAFLTDRGLGRVLLSCLQGQTFWEASSPCCCQGCEAAAVVVCLRSSSSLPSPLLGGCLNGKTLSASMVLGRASSQVATLSPLHAPLPLLFSPRLPLVALLLLRACCGTVGLPRPRLSRPASANS